MSADAILVLGASGLVGTHVVRELRTLGYQVVAVSRRPMNADDPLVRWVQADASRAADVARLPDCRRAVSTLGIWLTADVAPTLAAAGLERLVAFSSSSAVTKTDASDEGERQLAARLLAGEAAVLALAPGLQATVLRPTMIYGGSGDANVERIAGHLRRFHMFPLIGGGTGQRQPVHAADLGRAAVQALTTPGTEGKIYPVAGGEVLTVRRMIERIGAANEVQARFVRVPLRPAQRVLQELGRMPTFRRVPAGALERLTRDLVFDNASAAADFGYAPRAFEPPDYRSAG